MNLTRMRLLPFSKTENPFGQSVWTGGLTRSLKRDEPLFRLLLKALPKLDYNFLNIFEQKPEDTYNEYINPDRRY